MIGNSDIGIIIGSCEKQANAGPESQEISEKKIKRKLQIEQQLWIGVKSCLNNSCPQIRFPFQASVATQTQ